MITPDSKDWTWVLQRPCPECGFDCGSEPGSEVAALVRGNAQHWRRLLELGLIRPGRPDASSWSSLEYACHVRDVYQRYDARLALMLTRDDPLFANWDQDASADDDRYDEQDPTTVVDQLVAAATQLSRRLDSLSGSQWRRPGRRSDGASFTVDSIVRYMVHDTIHHIWDVTGVSHKG